DSHPSIHARRGCRSSRTASADGKHSGRSRQLVALVRRPSARSTEDTGRLQEQTRSVGHCPLPSPTAMTGDVAEKFLDARTRLPKDGHDVKRQVVDGFATETRSCKTKTSS